MDDSDSTVRPTAPPAPPGWYSRYWDGERWTETAHPGPQAAPARSDNTLEMVGWICAAVVPVVGIVIGIILAARNNVVVGFWMALISMGAIVFWLLMLTANTGPTY